MGRGALAVAWIGSLAPGMLATLDPAWSLGQGSELGWALVPWVALAGLPSWGPAAGRIRPAVLCGLALPPLALALALDHAAGIPWAHLAATLGAGLLLIFLLALAAERGAGRPVLHGVTWLLLVPGAFLLDWSLGLGGARVPGLETVAHASPLHWALAHASSPDPVRGSLAALGVAALCLLASARGRT